MAGNYPDVPAPRMAYDIDGTAAAWSNDYFSSNSFNMAQSGTTQFNDEGGAGYSVGRNTSFSVCYVFPQFRTLKGYAVMWGGDVYGSRDLMWSPDSTNGIDGVWNSLGAPAVLTTKTQLRDSITATNLVGVKAVRLRYSRGSAAGNSGIIYAINLYGTIEDKSLPMLRIWHPTLDEPLDDDTSADGAHLDWGDVAQSTMGDRQFRIKNNSASLTANSVIISTDVQTNTTPTIESQITYSDGGAFSASLDIGNLAPGALSPAITVRKSTLVNATLSLWTWRTVAEATSWS